MVFKPVILYVEDDVNSRDVMQIILQDLMQCETFYFFEESRNFLARVQSLTPQPDVIILDIHVAPHDGFEMIAMLRRDPAFEGVPIVALTASVMNEEIERLQQIGFDAIFPKPIDVDTFADDLRQVLPN